MINGWEFPSHVHHGDVSGSEPTYCLHVGPTNLLEDADVGGSVGQVGSHQM